MNSALAGGVPRPLRLGRRGWRRLQAGRGPGGLVVPYCSLDFSLLTSADLTVGLPGQRQTSHYALISDQQ